MASSKEAFARLGTWKKLQTPLKLTSVTKGGMPEILRGQVLSIDEESSLVCFLVSREEFPRLDLSGAAFRLGARMLEATRDEDVLTFEEEPARIKKWRN